MKHNIPLVLLSALTLVALLTGCGRDRPSQPTALTAEDVAAIGQTIDSCLEAYKAKDIDRHMACYATDAVFTEYGKYNSGASEIREKHIRPEFEEATFSKYESADRLVRGRNGIAYVAERNIIEFQTKDGKKFSMDRARTSYVLEKHADGSWKIVQLHFSGPSD